MCCTGYSVGSREYENSTNISPRHSRTEELSIEKSMEAKRKRKEDGLRQVFFYFQNGN